MNIWYLWDFHGQEEENLPAFYRKCLSRSAAKDIFILTYDRMRRYSGTWHMEKKQMFPFYLFLDSENEPLLAKELSRLSSQVFSENVRDNCEKYTRLSRLDKETEVFLRSLYGERHHLEMSAGVIQNGVPQITAGPLKGMERSISRIDRHKRLAKLTLPVTHSLGRMPDWRDTGRRNFAYIIAGLEITEKNL